MYRTHFRFPGHSETRYVESLPPAGSVVRSCNASWLVDEIGIDEPGFSTMLLREPPAAPGCVDDDRPNGKEVASDAFRHEALLYRGESEFVSEVSSFLRAGLATAGLRSSFVEARKIDLLREDLGDTEGVLYADMAEVGHNPARIIPAWREFVNAHGGRGTRLRGVGEPINPERSPDELVECERHEDLLNLGQKESVPPREGNNPPPAAVSVRRRSAAAGRG